MIPVYIKRFHKRWDEVIGRVPSSDAMWAEHEVMARTWAGEFIRFHKDGTPIHPPSFWKDWTQATEERHALGIAQQLAEQERTEEAKRDAAISALIALGLMAGVASAVIGATQPAPSPAVINQPSFAVRSGGLETCTYRLNALQGRMLCVDAQGNVRAR